MATLTYLLCALLLQKDKLRLTIRCMRGMTIDAGGCLCIYGLPTHQESVEMPTEALCGLAGYVTKIEHSAGLSATPQ